MDERKDSAVLLSDGDDMLMIREEEKRQRNDKSRLCESDWERLYSINPCKGKMARDLWRDLRSFVQKHHSQGLDHRVESRYTWRALMKSIAVAEPVDHQLAISAKNHYKRHAGYIAFLQKENETAAEGEKSTWKDLPLIRQTLWAEATVERKPRPPNKSKTSKRPALLNKCPPLACLPPLPGMAGLIAIDVQAERLGKKYLSWYREIGYWDCVFDGDTRDGFWQGFQWNRLSFRAKYTWAEDMGRPQGPSHKEPLRCDLLLNPDKFFRQGHLKRASWDEDAIPENTEEVEADDSGDNMDDADDVDDVDDSGAENSELSDEYSDDDYSGNESSKAAQDARDEMDAEDKTLNDLRFAIDCGLQKCEILADRAYHFGAGLKVGNKKVKALKGLELARSCAQHCLTAPSPALKFLITGPTTPFRSTDHTMDAMEALTEKHHRELRSLEQHLKMEMEAFMKETVEEVAAPLDALKKRHAEIVRKPNHEIDAIEEKDCGKATEETVARPKREAASSRYSEEDEEERELDLLITRIKTETDRRMDLLRQELLASCNEKQAALVARQKEEVDAFMAATKKGEEA
ncbi:hypothetical protein B0T16DRAFT_463084 [Cercophora newfieldiana]|uniref:Uncharacterized protein n=1 Tax=Cercophora newfieldiana TaxID=92897 RepID=A0AA39XSG8_9PEZI|nr:hypothetical protein B0T16DRAFT_463084 [Cercophora newfieldiana]